jgi:hypothetical protein
MGPEVLRRVRWGNVALAAAVIAALAVAIAWPRLAPGPSRLPPDAAAPLVGTGVAPPEDEARGRGEAAPGTERSGAEPRGGAADGKRTAKPGRNGAGRKSRGTSRRGKPRAHRGGERRRKPRTQPPRHATPPPRVVATAPPNSAGGEFGFER